MADDDETPASGAGQGTGDDHDGSERQEYYLSLIKKIVEQQKKFLGEKVALKQARRAPLHIDKDGNIIDFYGSGQKALETLRGFTEHQELYLTVIRDIVDTFKDFLGDKTALAKARKAPLFIDKDGNVSAYYGQGRNALEILVNQFESVLGREVARVKIRAAVRQTVPEDQMELLPERIRPVEHHDEEGNLLNRLLHKVIGGEVQHVA